MCGTRALTDEPGVRRLRGFQPRGTVFHDKTTRLTSTRAVPVEKLMGSVASGVLATRFFATDYRAYAFEVR